MAYGNYGGRNYGGRNYNNGGNYSGGNQGYNQAPPPQQEPVPSIDDQIRERLEVFQKILLTAEQMGIPKDELLMASGLTAWVTSMVGNFGRK